jgi:heme/copper-type cytochrome/quinol oxidase subunit 2
MKIRPAYAVDDENRSLINIIIIIIIIIIITIIIINLTALCGYNEEFLNAKPGSTRSSHWHLIG